MVGELFLPHDMPEPPKESFFKGLFGGGARSLDREELCEYALYIKLNIGFLKQESNFKYFVLSNHSWQYHQ